MSKAEYRTVPVRTTDETLRDMLGDEVNGGFIRDLCYTVWQKARYGYNGGPGDWANDTLPTVQAGVQRIRTALSMLSAAPAGAGDSAFRREERASIPAVDASLVEAGTVVWWKEGGVNYFPQGESFTVSGSCRAEPLVTRQSAIDALAALSPRPADREAVAALEDIRKMTDADDDESYRADDREGCLDAVHGRATEALAAILALSRSSAPADPITAGYERSECNQNPPQEGSK